MNKDGKLHGDLAWGEVYLNCKLRQARLAVVTFLTEVKDACSCDTPSAANAFMVRKTVACHPPNCSGLGRSVS